MFHLHLIFIIRVKYIIKSTHLLMIFFRFSDKIFLDNKQIYFLASGCVIKKYFV